MRRAFICGWLCVTTAACAGLLGIDDVGYAPQDSAGGTDATTLDSPVDAASEAAPCSADLTRDREHCGWCSHSCGAGGTCSDGLCAPELVIAGLTKPGRLFRVAGATFVSTSDGVFRCATTGCADGGEVLLHAGPDEIVSAFSASDAGMVVGILDLSGGGLGVASGRVVGCPLGVCSSPRVLAPSEANLQTVAQSDDDVLWGRDDMLETQLVSCRGATCDGGVEIGRFVGFTPTVNAIAAAGPSILWMIRTGLLETKDGGTAVLVAIADTGEARPLVRDGNRVYWGNFETRQIEQCDLTAGCTGSRAPLGEARGEARALALDTSFVYMAVDTNTEGGAVGYVGRHPRSGGTTELLARVKSGLRAIAVDSTHVYWAEGVIDGKVWRVPK